MIGRRTVLSILGLVPASAVAAADFGTPIDPRQPGGASPYFGRSNSQTTARALRALADQIEANAAWVHKMDLNSALRPDDFLAHTITIEFSMDEKTA